MSGIRDAFKALLAGAQGKSVDVVIARVRAEAGERLEALAEAWSTGLEARVRRAIPRRVLIALWLVTAGAAALILAAVVLDIPALGYGGAAIAGAAGTAWTARWIALRKATKAIADMRRHAETLVPQQAAALAEWLRAALARKTSDTTADGAEDAAPSTA